MNQNNTDNSLLNALLTNAIHLSCPITEILFITKPKLQNYKIHTLSILEINITKIIQTS